MNKFVVLFALVASVFAEPPSQYGQYEQQYQQVQYASPAYTSYEQPATTAYYDGGDDGSSYVDDALLARIAQILEQHEGSSSSSGYSGGSGYETSSGYGVPAHSGGVLIGKPERAQRIAEFDLTSSSGGYNSGGYTSGGY